MSAKPTITPMDQHEGGGEGAASAVEVRAEEIVERLSAEIGRFARRLVGRAREEAEDILAEAQTIRRGGRSPRPGP